MTFHKRLLRCVKDGRLITADLRDWFNRPYYTCWTWQHEGNLPRGPQGELAFSKLKLLEWVLRERQGLPVPSYVTERQRPAYIKQVRAHAEHNGRVSKASATR